MDNVKKDPGKDNREGLSREDAGRLGGDAVVKKYGPEHMASIGKKGGEAVSRNKEHMAKIGKKGGKNSKRKSG
jgi:general stress protein YciG